MVDAGGRGGLHDPVGAQHIHLPGLVQWGDVRDRRGGVDNSVHPVEVIGPRLWMQRVAADDPTRRVGDQVDTAHLDALGDQAVMQVAPDETACASDENGPGHRHAVTVAPGGYARRVRIARFALPDDSMVFASIEGDGVTEPEMVRPMRGHPFGEPDLVDGTVPLAGLRMLPPVLPSKIVAIGKNYAAHATETGSEVPTEPLMFLKPNTAVIGPGGSIRLPEQSQRVDHEAELAVVIGKLCRHVTADDAERVILGYTCANDVTARDLQIADGQWTRAKGFDTFCPLGPWIQTDRPPDSAVVQCEVNGDVRQQAPLSDLVFGVPQLIEYVSSVMTLLPGDVLLTGTPAGIGPLVDGDHVKVTIDGIGSLSNEVILGD